ncbi:hypothetical protein JTE90_003788 [Oedothorax gibbosus]|uniref:Secreted protein n=1 Tax=Oedothorax gibbosus TaxID=931172 RepID=A0AAV6V9J4_9ARAC|nr:hypothetical protein JTE90_003788 [Oedothorax gibbosus]
MVLFLHVRATAWFPVFLFFSRASLSGKASFASGEYVTAEAVLVAVVYSLRMRAHLHLVDEWGEELNDLFCVVTSSLELLSSV